VTTPTDPGTPPVPRAAPRPRRVPRPKPNAWQRLPFTVRWILPAVAASIGIKFWTDLRAMQVVFTFVTATGAPAPDVKLEFFVDATGPSDPSPPPRLGEVVVASGDEFRASSVLVPRRALVRWSAAGHGSGSAAVAAGEQHRIVLNPSGAVSGAVVQPSALWLFGARALPAPVAGARIVVMGGGERGLPLAEAPTGADGSFTVGGFDDAILQPTLRVLATGFSLAHVDAIRGAAAEPALAVVTPTQPLRGRVALPAGIAGAGLRVLARGLPGIEAVPAVDGSFSLDHVPAWTWPRLVLHGLPAGFTQRGCQATVATAAEVVVERALVVRGYVLDALTQAPVVGATVYHENGADGLSTCTTGVDGSWEFTDLPSGSVRLQAYRKDRESGTVRSGNRNIELRAETPELENILIRID
jgi:hypothetical protein